jgi:hypothetical protein
MEGGSREQFYFVEKMNHVSENTTVIRRKLFFQKSMSGDILHLIISEAAMITVLVDVVEAVM